MGTIPTRPAAYVRDLYADPGDESGLAESCRMMIRLAREAAWPKPVIYADAGPATEPGSQYAALVEAITAGRHDAVMLHVETAVVLQVALATGEFRPGRYVREGSWHNGWKRDEDRP
jgi:hypothetical protein